jgi:hypothetical protein
LEFAFFLTLSTIKIRGLRSGFPHLLARMGAPLLRHVASWHRGMQLPVCLHSERHPCWLIAFNCGGGDRSRVPVSNAGTSNATGCVGQDPQMEMPPRDAICGATCFHYDYGIWDASIITLLLLTGNARCLTYLMTQ